MNYAMLRLGYAVALNVMGRYINTCRRSTGNDRYTTMFEFGSGKGQCNAMLYSQHPFQKLAFNLFVRQT